MEEIPRASSFARSRVALEVALKVALEVASEVEVVEEEGAVGGIERGSEEGLEREEEGSPSPRPEGARVLTFLALSFKRGMARVGELF